MPAIEATRDSLTPAAQRVDQDVEAALLYAAYGRKRLNLHATVLAIVVLGAILWQLLPLPKVAFWLAAVLCSSVLGYAECAAFRRAAPAQGSPEIGYWQRVFLVQATLAGAAWGVGPTLLMQVATGLQVALFLGALLGVCMVAMISLAEQRKAMQGFVAAALVPPALALAVIGGAMERLVALVLLCGLAVVFVVGRRFHFSMRGLMESEQRHRTLIEWSPSAIGVHSEGLLRYVNPAAVKLFGARTAQELVGQPIMDRVHADFHHVVQERVRQALHDGTTASLTEMKFLLMDGSAIDVEVQGTPIGFEGKPAIRFAARDITGRKLAEEELRIAARAFESQQGMTITNARREILRVNKAFTEITGYSAEEVVGQNPRLLSSGRHDASFYAAMWEQIAHEGSWQGEIWNRRKSGEVFPEWLTISAVKDDKGQATHYVAAFTDITSRKTAEEQIKHLAFYDPLTGLPNRRLLLDRLEQALAASARHLRKGALLFVDLDNFKTLNDTLGHYQGDLLLEQVASRLSACIRDGDTVARVGGDEFVVMLEDLSENELDAANQAETVAEKVLAAMARPYSVGTQEQHGSASIGVTLFGSRQLEGSGEPLKRAELAMFQAKGAGRNALRFFDPQMQAELSARADLENELRDAVQKGQFELYYQPQVRGDGVVCGAEALVRWRHPERGLVSPAEFIPLAEETGLILPLGQWVLQAACSQLAAWSTRPALAQLTLSVNVSARQFGDKGFVDQVIAALASSGANARLLKLELTESVLVHDVEGVIGKMRTLKLQGLGFSLDDFGTGYSSLSYLSRLPLDQLKIDRSFVMNIESDDNAVAICAATISLAHSLKLQVVAEGVETQAQRYFLSTVHGCDTIQGYLFSRPLPLAAFESFVRPA